MYRKFFMMGIVLMCSLNVSVCLGQSGSKGSDKEYTISSDDILEITVYGEGDLSVTTRVSQDGTISYPLLGNIKAAGFTVRELEAYITDLLGQDYLVMPQVSIFVKQYSKISVLGQVKSQGSYEMKENLTLTQAIALTGGFSPTADTSRVKIIRSMGGRKETLEVNVDQILEKAAPDIELKANDTIIVEGYGRISIMGQVVRPGVYNLQRNLKVVEAVGIAGGFTPTAAPDATRVVRVENGEKKVINVPVASIMRGGDSSRDILLQEGDTIVVPESFF